MDDDEDFYSQQAWEERYRSKDQNWSGNPNAVLVSEATALPPGTALDAGAGEGADAIWLAERGWQVTGVDISTVALGRAAARADELGLAITWQQADLANEPAPARYDLVIAFFLHMPKEPRKRMFAHLAAAVAPGGRLLVVGHDPSDLHHAGVARPHLLEAGWTYDEVVDSLGPGWTIDVAEARPRQWKDPDGRPMQIRDAVTLARRASVAGPG
jgi:SAM-dependent methyltransferase